MVKFYRIWFIVFASLLVSHCITPGAKIYKQANTLGLGNGLVHGNYFSHVIFYHHLAQLRNSDSIHIYIEGDGKPFAKPTEINVDPTPKNPLALKLLAQDRRPSLYIGRPCYFGYANTRPCSSKYWTSHRYAQEVVDSMATAIRGFLGQHINKRLVFIGYSGGAPLAMLLAPRFKTTKAVVTIAGNIDIDAWTDHHQYTQMTYSLNPARMPILPRNIFQLHLTGRRDKNVPPQLVQPEVRRQTTGNVKIYENYNHVCCWLKIWPDILQRYGFSYERRIR